MIDQSQSVRKTLLSALFVRPRPIGKKSFDQSRNTLFPGEDDFRLFLQAEQSEELVKYAKRVLFRLVHRHRFSPPTAMLLNLLDFERWRQGEGKRSGREYVGQDHFVHLVNLYLLGIYLFSYHVNIHKHCTLQLNRTRRHFTAQESEDGTPLRIPSNNYELFAKAWSLFVLYHDLGYPLEGVKPEDREKHSRWLLPFKKLVELSARDLSLKSLSNLLVLKVALVDESAPSIAEMYLGHGPSLHIDLRSTPSPHSRLVWKVHDSRSNQLSAESATLLIETWGPAKHVRRLPSSDVTTISSLLPDEDICAVLEDNSTGNPILLMPKEEKDFLFFWLDTKNNIPSSLQRLRWPDLHRDAFQGSMLTRTSRHLSWSYFVRNGEKNFDTLVADIFGDQGEAFSFLAQRLLQREDFRAAALLDRNVPGDFAFKFFWELVNLSAESQRDGDPGQQDDLSRLFERIESSFTVVSKEIPSLMGKLVEDLLEEKSKGDTDFYELLANESPERSLKKIVSMVTSEKKTLEDKLSESLGPKLRDQIAFERAWRITLDNLDREIAPLMTTLADSGEVSPFAAANIDSSFSLRTLPKESSLLKKVSSKLAAIGLSSLETILKSYWPSFARERNSGYQEDSFIDHGIGSFVVLAIEQVFYGRCIGELLAHSEERLEAPSLAKLLRLAFVVESKRDDHLLVFEGDNILEEVGVAVLIHNLYPSGLPKENRGYRTNIEQSPFPYLAMLADGLQIWDRDKQLNQARGELPISVYGHRFDIKVETDRIFVSVWGRDLDIKSEQRRLNQNFADYLNDAEKIIRLRIAQS